MATKKTETVIALPALNIQFLKLRLKGDSPLICHAWSEKAKRQMLDAQMKKAKQAKEAKNPQADYEQSLYHHPDGGYGFPAAAFKAAAVDACSSIEGVTKVEARGAFHIIGDMVKIDGEPRPREDMVGSTDYRVEGGFL